MIGVGGRDWKHYMRRKPLVVKRRVRKGIPDCLRGLVWQLISGSRDLLLMNQGVYEVHFISFGCYWHNSYLPNVLWIFSLQSNWHVMYTVYLHKFQHGCRSDKYEYERSRSDFFGYVECCKRGSSDERRARICVVIKPNRVLINLPLFLAATGAVWNISCRIGHNQGYFSDISIACFFPAEAWAWATFPLQCPEGLCSVWPRCGLCPGVSPFRSWVFGTPLL